KGAEGTKPATLAEGLPPEQLAALQSLKERRAAEMSGKEPTPPAEVPPEDKFTPYVPPKGFKDEGPPIPAENAPEGVKAENAPEGMPAEEPAAETKTGPWLVRRNGQMTDEVAVTKEG